MSSTPCGCPVKSLRVVSRAIRVDGAEVSIIDSAGICKHNTQWTYTCWLRLSQKGKWEGTCGDFKQSGTGYNPNIPKTML